MDAPPVRRAGDTVDAHLPVGRVPRPGAQTAAGSVLTALLLFRTRSERTCRCTSVSCAMRTTLVRSGWWTTPSSSSGDICPGEGRGSMRLSVYFPWRSAAWWRRCRSLHVVVGRRGAAGKGRQQGSTPRERDCRSTPRAGRLRVGNSPRLYLR